MPPGHELEARRQQALLAALTARAGAPPGLALAGDPQRAVLGLAAYRGNAAANAARALGAVFPTVAALIGAADFDRLADDHRLAHPPTRGDLGDWGAAFPAWLGAHAGFADWPYFADCARLDLAVHRAGRAADAELDAASFARLGDGDPSRLVLVPTPGAAVLASRWPIVAIHAAHHGGVGGEAPGTDARADDRDTRVRASMRSALADPAAETAFVFRDGWRVRVMRLDEPAARWTAAWLAGAPLAAALDAAGAGFDFAAWLAEALAARWVCAVAVADPTGPGVAPPDYTAPDPLPIPLA